MCVNLRAVKFVLTTQLTVTSQKLGKMAHSKLLQRHVWEAPMCDILIRGGERYGTSPM